MPKIIVFPGRTPVFLKKKAPKDYHTPVEQIFCQFAPHGHCRRRNPPGECPISVCRGVKACPCRGRVPRPGGKMLHFRLGIGEFVTGRLRDGKPVPYNLSLILLYKLQSLQYAERIIATSRVSPMVCQLPAQLRTHCLRALPAKLQFTVPGSGTPGDPRACHRRKR